MSDYCMKVSGRMRRSTDEPWSDVVCFVSYGDAQSHRKIVEASFQYHLRLDMDEMKKKHSDHFIAPHNVARAILLYHYFRIWHYFFEDDHWDYIRQQELPDREPDADGEDYKLWINSSKNKSV